MSLATVQVIEDSIYNGVRLTTLEVEYPRYIHAEVMTHRVFSRNFQSTRAIPLRKAIFLLREDDWYPIFMKNRSGMMANESIIGEELEKAKFAWCLAKEQAIQAALNLNDLNIHKQVANRVLEPFSKIKGIISATEWDNFFSLRIAADAQQEIQVLAKCIKDSMDASKPKQLDISHWHLPYVREEERDLDLSIQKKLSAARCARVSYLNHNGENSIEDNLRLHDQLLSSRHMSPFEHQATPSTDKPREFYNNFRGWIQYRYYLD